MSVLALKPRNPMMSALMSVLIFEVVVFWLAFAGMIRVSDVPVMTAVIWTTTASVLAIVATGGLRKGWGFPVGWAVQAIAIAMGVLTPWMYAMGIIFALIWITSFVLGKRLEQRGEKAPTQRAGQ